MAHPIILGLLELIAVGSCSYGMYYLYYASSVLGMILSGLWFIMGLISNICGIIALVYLYYGEEDEVQQTSQYFVQYHYLCAWLTIVIGYPNFVVQAWMAHYPTPYAYLHILLSVIPMVSWIQRKTSTIVWTTQIVTIFAVISHAYISYLAWNIWGLIGAGLMIVNVIALSMPTRYNLFGFSSRELYVIGLAATSYIFCLAVGQNLKNPRMVKSLSPFFK